LSETADRDIDELWVLGLKIEIADSPFRQSARAKILDDDIRSGGQFSKNGSACGLTQVESQASLATIDRLMHEGKSGIRAGQMGRKNASDFAARRLDLDDFGS
jgi:hypothetical protein